MARNIQLVSKSFKVSEEVAVELTKLIFGEKSANPAALAKFSTFDKDIVETLRESIDPDYTKEEEAKATVDKNEAETKVEEKKEESKSEVAEEDKKPLEENDEIDKMLSKVIIPFRFKKEEDKKPLEEKKEELKKEIGKFSGKVEKEIEHLKSVLGTDEKLDKCIKTLMEFVGQIDEVVDEAADKALLLEPVIEEAEIVETKEEDKKPLEEKKEKSADAEFKPVTAQEVITVLSSIIKESVSNLPEQVNEYLKGVFEGMKKLDFSKIKSNEAFDKRINTTLTKLVDPISEILDAAGFVVNKEILKEQFYKTADGVKEPITLTAKFVYNPNFSIRRISNGYSLDASEMKEFRNELSQCIEGMTFDNVEEFKSKVMDNHEQVFAPVYAKYNLQEDLAYSYDHSKDNPFELEISLKDTDEAESFIVGEEVSPEELNEQISAVLNAGSGKVVVTKRNWKRKETTKK